MASSKNLFILLGVLFALVLLISSEVAASTDQTEETNAVEDGKHKGPGYGYPGKGHGGYPGKGHGGYPGKGPKKGCHHGCCRGYRYGPGCKRCCATAHETPDAQFEDDLNN